jgi:hypothetical protein
MIKAQTVLVSSGQLNCCSLNCEQCVAEPLSSSSDPDHQSSSLCDVNAVLQLWVEVTVLTHTACLVSKGHLKYTYNCSTISELSFYA